MTTLYPFQREGVEALKKFKCRALLADPMGTGKTVQALTCLVEKKLFPAVVVCPASLKWNWQYEAKMHYNLRGEVLSGKTPPRKGGLGNLPPLVIINYDVLPSWVDWLLKMKPKLLVLDECHYVSNRSAQRSKASRKLSKSIPHVLALSGTPLLNKPVELHHVLSVLRPDLWGSFLEFAHRYCGPRRTPWGMRYDGATNLKELHRILKKEVMVRRRKKDVLLQLPPKRRCVVPIELSREGKKEYKEASENFLRWLSQHKPQALKSSMRAEALARITHLKVLLGSLKKGPVTSWVQDHLDSGEKLICFGVHKNMVKGLEKEFGSVAVRVDGSVEGKKRQECFNRFSKDDQVRLLVGNIKAAGVGWNGVASRSVAFAEFGWTPGEHTQAEDRSHRLGQTRGVICYYLTAVGTIEETFCRVIHRKQRVLTSTLDGEGRSDPTDLMDELIRELKG